MNYIDDSDYEELELDFDSDDMSSTEIFLSTPPVSGTIDTLNSIENGTDCILELKTKTNTNKETIDSTAYISTQNIQPKYQIQSYNKLQTPSYYIITSEEDMIESKLKEFNSTVPTYSSLDCSEKLQILIKYEWNISKIEQDINEGDHIENSPFYKAGLRPSTGELGLFYTKESEFTCPICCETRNETHLYKLLDCNHEYCTECYTQYLKSSSRYTLQKCMGDCPTVIPLKDLKRFIGEESFEKFCLFSARSHIKKTPDVYKMCPSTNCKCIIEVLQSVEPYIDLHIAPIVACSENHIFCFNCNKEEHSPCDCEISQEWVKKTSKESKALNWVLANTKECPKCSVNIEKNGGCNHMICQNCEYQFCWVCDSNWESHKGSNFKCVVYRNNVAPEGTKKKNAKLKEADIKYSFQRFRHFYRLFSDCEQSSTLDLKLYAEIEKRIMKLQKKVGISWIEGQFLDDCMKEMIEARKVLKWSFVLIYYSDPSHNFTKMFEDNQMHLMSSIDKLAELFAVTDPEQVISQKSSYLNLSAFIKTRKKAVIDAGRDLIKQKVSKL